MMVGKIVPLDSAAPRTTTRPSEFHQVAEEHLRKILADTLADLNVAIGLVRTEDTMLNSVLMRSWNRIVGAKGAR